MKKIASFLTTLVIVASIASNDVSAATRFSALLLGSEEVPAVSTAMTGTFDVTATQDLSFSYNLAVRNANQVTAAHMHCGEKGSNGPVVANIYVPASPVNGTIFVSASDVVLASSSSTCSPAISSKADLLQAMNDGRMYVNVHTTANPAGEIRGQLQGKQSGIVFPAPQPGSGGGSGSTTSPADIVDDISAGNQQLFSSIRTFQQSLFSQFFPGR